MIVKDYGDDEVIHYYCQRCDLEGKLDLKSIVSDNCATDIEVKCQSCREVYVLFIVKCKNEALADDLNARLAVLKSNRSAGGIDDGNKDDEERRDSGGEVEETATNFIGIGESIDGPY